MPQAQHSTGKCSQTGQGGNRNVLVKTKGLMSIKVAHQTQILRFFGERKLISFLEFSECPLYIFKEDSFDTERQIKHI